MPSFLCFLAMVPLLAHALTQRVRGARQLGDMSQPTHDSDCPERDQCGENDCDWWGAVMKDLHAKPAPDVATTNTRICLQGKLVPQLFLLGVQKAGTSSMAVDFVAAGVRSAIDGRKELHTFDELCGFPRIKYRTGGQLEGEELAGQCETSEESMAQWLNQSFGQCKEEQGPALIDMTPLNMRIPGLPNFLTYMYRQQYTPKLGFIILVREPLERLHSGFYQAWIHGGQRIHDVTLFDSFGSYVDMVFERAPEMLLSGNVSRDFPLDEFYRSMYGRTLEPWFEHFAGRHFVIVAMKAYFGVDIQVRQSAMRQIFAHFSIGADPDLVKLTEGHSNDYPSLEEDLAQDAITKLNARFFIPDTKNLTKMLSNKRDEGILIPGYIGDDHAETIYEFLLENW